ncbi:LysM peptidoglycan-binding domain-containing protein [Zavarzinia compransoris]|uniref:LysM peptidoglycan-binding domain-containing protein n=1 Tax=Zavarzinia marina TaxID=2911065 RepID=UPI001F231A8E|nr:LysM peptidoglycan-binding domain-containing protein [Zavarzinia marina]MCF4166641.1 LysM peptidoglycan-binding domain-containing protein [Zavarzinia marina]
MQEDRAEEGLGRRAAVGGAVALGVLLLIGALLILGGEPQAPAPAGGTPAAEASPGADPATGHAPDTAAATPATPTPAMPPPAADAATASRAEENVAPPTFDVARIAAEGTAVLAGRAPAGSTVEVVGNGDLIGTTDAQRGDGAWVLVIQDPLPEGTLELSLVAVLADGNRVPSQEVVLVDVPLRRKPGVPVAEGDIADKPAEAPVAVVTGRSPGADAGPTRILQGPDGAPPAGKDKAGVGLDLVEYGPDGAPVLSGRGPAGAVVRLYLDDVALAETGVGDDGTWRVTPEIPVAPGRYRLRLDAVDAGGKVIARREVPFERARPEAVAGGAGGGEGQTASASNFTVQPGNSLWRIARDRFGDGFRYIDIYRANEGQIRDPDLIYPGQVLELPPPR